MNIEKMEIQKQFDLAFKFHQEKNFIEAKKIFLLRNGMFLSKKILNLLNQCIQKKMERFQNLKMFT